MSGWMLVLSHVACLAIGAFVALHPDTIRGWTGRGLDWIKSHK